MTFTFEYPESDGSTEEFRAFSSDLPRYCRFRASNTYPAVSGFLTGMYVVFMPILTAAFGKRAFVQRNEQLITPSLNV